jgi:hypothetical protein
MAYKNFTFQQLESNFGIIQKRGKVVPVKNSLKPTDWLLQSLELSKKLSLNTEKALSEYLIAPILGEIKLKNDAHIELYSGAMLNADKKVGLNGECDFLISLSPGSILIKSPIISVVEAKQGELEKAVPQAAAQMYGAQIFNKTNDRPVEIIYGVVSDGREWLFLKLEKTTLWVDESRFNIGQLSELLGALQWVVDNFK